MKQMSWPMYDPAHLFLSNQTKRKENVPEEGGLTKNIAPPLCAEVQFLKRQSTACPAEASWEIPKAPEYEVVA
jgi:hypothetical protein